MQGIFCSYGSQKSFRVKDKRIASVYWGIIVGVALYISLFTVWYSKGYQTIDFPVSSVAAKVEKD